MAGPARKLTELTTPCFVVDLDTVKRNCDKMKARCDQLGIKLRPHVKTHKTVQAGLLQTSGTRRGIVVSTVREAEFFADAGFDDIAYAYTVGADKIPRLQKLAARLQLFHVLVDHAHQVALLEANPPPEGKKWSVFLKVDTGYHRAGLHWASQAIPALVETIVNSPCLTLEGLYTHEGLSYKAQGDAVRQKSDECAERLLQVTELLGSRGIECRTVASGSTPTCSLPGQLTSKMTEIHPGNYVFYDVQQLLIGSCKRGDIAGRVMTRILSHYPERNELLVDCGFLGLSHDGIGALPDGSMCMVQGKPRLCLKSFSQEYGLIGTSDGSKIDFESLPIGSELFLLPYHACATAAMHPVYYIHSGSDIVDTWEPCRGW